MNKIFLLSLVLIACGPVEQTAGERHTAAMAQKRRTDIERCHEMETELDVPLLARYCQDTALPDETRGPICLTVAEYRRTCEFTGLARN